MPIPSHHDTPYPRIAVGDVLNRGVVVPMNIQPFAIFGHNIVGDDPIVTGNVEPVVKLLTDTIEDGLHEQFSKVEARKNYDRGDVAAGREYVEAYVGYVHYVEGLYDAAKESSHGHYEETAANSTPAATCKTE